MRNEFYVLQRPRDVSCSAVVTREMRLGQEICPVEPSHARTWRVRGAITVDLSESDEADCLWTDYDDCLLDSGIVQELLGMGLRGLITHPVYATGSQQTRSYTLIRPGGWGGMAKKESGIRLVRYHECCGYRRYSAVKDTSQLVDPDQWDGSDLFIVWPMPNCLFMSRKMRDLLARMRLTGVELVPAADGQFGTDGFSPGRLSHYFVARRAELIGRQHGID